MEEVDILVPPKFEKSGRTKPREQAIDDGDWIGTFNLWVVQDKPTPAIVYQQRGPNKTWAPNKLDVTVGGRYSAGEELADGLREVREELGKRYAFKDLTFLGRKLNVSPDTKSRLQHTVVHIFMIKDNSSLEEFEINEEEVYALCLCPISQLVKAHTEDKFRFSSPALRADGKKMKVEVSKDSFPYNWDNYHFKIALLAQRFLKGEKNLIY